MASENLKEVTLQVLKDLRAEMRLIRTEVGELRAEVGELRAEVGAVRAEVGAVRTEVGAVRTEVGAVRTEVGALRVEVGELRTRMGAVESSLSDLRTEVGELRVEMRGEFARVWDEFRTVREDMAAELGVSTATISRWMNSDGTPPNRGYITSWAAFTGCDLQWLLTGEGTSTDGQPKRDSAA